VKFDRRCLLVIVFFVLSLIGAFHHELSLDEARPWLIMSETPWSLIVHETRCEMHCLPWFYALKGLSSLTVNPFSMQVLSVILATFAFGLMALFSPFSYLEKCLLLFNYYFFFEYNLIARPYMLTTMGIFFLCLSFSRRRERPVPFLLGLLFLENTTYFGIFLTFPFASLLIYEHIAGKSPWDKLTARRAYPILASYFLIGIWYALPLSSAYNCFDLNTADIPVTWNRLFASAWDVTRAFFIIGNDAWNEHAFDYSPWGKWFLISLWLLLVGSTVYSFRKHRTLFYIFISSVFIIFAYRFCKPMYFGSFLRHLGILSVIYVGCLWIARKDGVEKNRFAGLMFLLFLVTGAYSGIRLFIEDFRRPFSHGKNVHEFIHGVGYENHKIIPDSLLFTSSYLVYSEREYVDYTEDPAEEARYFPLSSGRKHVPVAPAVVRGNLLVPRIPEDMFKKVIRSWFTSNSDDALVILNYPPDYKLMSELGLRLEREFGSAVNPNENYYIFRR